MISILIKSLLFTSFVQAATRECIVSDWTTWSQCIGDCDFGLAVRNRDVVAPPFPIRYPNGTVYTPLCPHMFETKTCFPESCHSESKAKDPFPTPGPLMDEKNATILEEERVKTRKHGSGSHHHRPLRVEGVLQRNGISRSAKHHRNSSSVKNTTEPANMSSVARTQASTTPQRETVAASVANSSGPLNQHATVNKSNGVVGTSEGPLLRESILENTSLQDERLNTPNNTRQPLNNDVATTETVTSVGPDIPQINPRDSGYFVNSLTIDLPMKKKITAEVEKRLKTKLNINKIKYRNFGELDSPPTTTESTMNDVLRQLESAADLNIPLDDKHIRKALRKNRTLMKALLDAYKYRRNSNKSNETMKNVVSAESSEVPTNQPIATDSNDTSTDSPNTSGNAAVWSHSNYVPNTRQHASDITNKLYMTHEIVQALSDEPIRRSPILRVECLENHRCCKIERTVCPDGQKPKLVKRYYRPPNAAVCMPYHYPKCGQLEEMDEKPIQFEQNCQDLCFATSEKRIEPFTRTANDSS